MSQVIEPKVDPEAKALAAVYRLLLAKAAERRARQTADKGKQNQPKSESKDE